ncbi:MAG: NUDIX hydrolase [Nitrosopumilus sp.]|nr:NUDIX hydrolase [Nitrosopumilus sp.]
MQNVTVGSSIKEFLFKIYGEESTASFKGRKTYYHVSDPSLNIETDNYGGCHINIIPSFTKERAELIKQAIEDLSIIFKENKEFNSLWLNLPLPCHLNTVGMIAPDNFLIGTPDCDLIYDRQAKKLRVWLWLNKDKDCTIPLGATHSVGGTALIIDRIAKKIALVVNKDRDHSWNLPGGSFDLKDQSTSITALREFQEETGIQLTENDKYESCLIGQMQFPENQFATAISQIWAFYFDNVSLRTLDPPKNEIVRAEWISFDDVLQSNGRFDGLILGVEIREGLRAAIKGLGCKKIENGCCWKIVHISEASG